MAVPAPPPVDPPPPDLLTLQARAIGLPPCLDVSLHAALTASAPTPAAEALVGLALPPPPADADALAAAAPATEDTPAPSRRWVTTARQPLVADTSFFLVPHLLTFDDGDALMGALEGGSPDLLSSVAVAAGLATPPAELQLTSPSAAGASTGAAGAAGAAEQTSAAPPLAAVAAAAPPARPSRPAVRDIPSLLSRLGNPPLSTLDAVRAVDLRGDGLDAAAVAGLRLPLLTPGVGVLDVRGNALPVGALTALAAELSSLRVLGCDPLAPADAVAVAAAAPGLEVINGVRVERRPAAAAARASADAPAADVSAADAPATDAPVADAPAADASATEAPAAAASPPAAAPAVPAATAAARAAAPVTTTSGESLPPAPATLLAAIGPVTHAYTVARPDAPADTRAVWYVPAPLGACLRHAPAAAANVRVGRIFWGGHPRDVVWATRPVAAGEALRRDYAAGVEGAAARAEVLEHFGVQD